MCSGKSVPFWQNLMIEAAGFSEILTSLRLHDITPQMTLMFIVTLFMWNNNAFWLQLDSSEADVRYELEVTDGWYGLTAVVDQQQCHRIHHGTVAVGTKLISYGAELLNCEQGCSPLELSNFFTRISSMVCQISCFSCRTHQWIDYEILSKLLCNFFSLSLLLCPEIITLTLCWPDGLLIKYPQFPDLLNALNVQPHNIFLLTVWHSRLRSWAPDCRNCMQIV